MREIPRTAVAVVGLGAVLPDAPDVAAFWSNLQAGRYSIFEAPVDRWDPALYYDPDPHAPDKTYSKIGGWVRQFDWDPLRWKLPIPPKVAEAMDRTQKFAVVAARQALADYGWPGRKLDGERTAVILGNAMAGELHYKTALRLSLPELERALEGTAAFSSLPEAQRAAIREGFRGDVAAALPPVTEDTMPGELANIIAGRVAALFDFHGPNFTVDAACASAMAALSAALEGLEEGDFDAVLTGGIDANMGAHTFIKFAKIGALSATGTRPFAAGADGFVMGEGGAVFLLKRLADAERDGDRIYAVLRGVGGSSDGRGKGITAPNPVGQRLAVGRAWRDAGLDPATVGLIEGHGTSTRVGDQTELESLDAVFGGLGLSAGSVPLGSVKSNIGHLKGAAGAAGLLKTVLALHHRQIPPSLNCERPNPAIDFAATPFYVNTRLAPWEARDGAPRRAGVSAFGFGGTNFHTVVEDYVPGRLDAAGRGPRISVAVPERGTAAAGAPRTPPRGALLVGAADEAGLTRRLAAIVARAEAGEAPPPAPADAADLAAPQRLAIDYADAADLATKGAKALRAFASGQAGMWRALRAQGVFRGAGAPGKVAFLYTGQGSQYAGMLQELARLEPIVSRTFAEADRVMEPLLGASLTARIFPSRGDAAELAEIEEGLRQTAITQPAVLSVSISLTRLLAEYGLVPDLVMGHSLGEYGALVAAGVLSFADALEAVSARGREMTRLAVADCGRMAAVMAPIPEIERVLAATEGYVVVANLNSERQAVIGGASDAVERASAALAAAGYTVRPLSVSHAFHTEIVAPASVPLRGVLRRIGLKPPAIPVVANVTGRFYPMGPGVEEEAIDLLARQIASPVRFVDGLETLWQAGARIFVEVGPKRALAGFVEDVLGDREGAVALATNHPKIGDLASVNQAVCGLWAAGVGVGLEPLADPEPAPRVATAAVAAPAESVVITGAALGLPGMARIFDDGNLGRLLAGETLIDAIPMRLRKRMVDKNVTRLVKDDAGGGPRFEVIADAGEVIKLAARGGQFDLAAEYGVAPERVEALDRTTQLALAAGLDALRDAGIPLVQNYKTTSRGTRLPDRWLLPEALRDSTGVIFASAFPGLDALLEISERYYADRERRARRAELESLRGRLAAAGTGRDALIEELERRAAALTAEIEREAFAFDRRFLFRVLSMGHSQFAELIGARGPNTQVNAACASSAQAMALAADWLRSQRCRRVVVISADDVTSENLLPWIGAGFLASGAAATDECVEDAAIPFDRRRHGMLLGMGAAALVLETAEGARERGVAPICELLGTVSANSAFHGTRLDVEHIGRVMERLVGEAEGSWGLDRHQMAPQTMFVSHETYTPARGGSAQAEVDALRRVFGPSADRIVIANTKGFTGHPMGVGIEEVVAVKALETGIVPPVANHREEDPDLGHLNLSQGGGYPIRYALRLAAGFGSQIAMTLLRWVETPAGRRRPDELGFAYRVADRARFQEWLGTASGDSLAELEVVHRTLRVRDRGVGARVREEEPGRETFAVAAPAVPGPAASTPVPPPTPVPAPEAPAAPAGEAGDPVARRVLELVAQQTGYPPEMLDPALDLEADLGIDTVKQAEMFAAIRGEWGIPRDENLKLRDYPTLGHAVKFVYDRRPDLEPAQGRTSSESRSIGVEELGREASGVAAPPVTTPTGPAPAPIVVAPSSFALPSSSSGLPAGTAGDPVRQRVLELVAQQTGYPPEMLDPALDLEADLGIDTVKQAEMFAAIRGEWDIPRDENLALRDYPTLAHAVKFVYDRRPDLAPAVAAHASSAPPGSSGDLPAGTAVAGSAPAALDSSARPSSPASDAPRVSVRRIPVPVLRPPLEFCAPTGVELGAGARVALMPDRGGVARALAARLGRLGVEVLALDPAEEPEALAGRLAAWAAEGPVGGLYWLPALDDEGDPAGLAPEAWRQAVRVRVKALAAAARALYEPLGRPGAFLVAGTRLGGLHGAGADGATAPLGGAVSGFVKAFAREREAATVKAIDFAASRRTAEPAEALIAETLRDPGAVEIGHLEGRRWTVGLAEGSFADVAPAPGGLTLGPESVVVVSGAAGSIVAAVVADLAAAAGGGAYHLLDLAPPPDPASPDLARFLAGDRDGLKRDLFARLQAAGEKPTPARIERDLATLEREAATAGALRAIEAAGGTARYHRVDLRDREAVAAALAEARATHGRIDLLLHAGGLEISRRLPDKAQEEFDRVFDVKADGWVHLLAAAGDLPVAAAVVFTSIAGRFGNAGQTDYSAANDFLVKAAADFARRRPGALGLALDWTAWADLGMATRGSIPQIMAAAGIDLLPPREGVPVVRAELAAATRGEVVVAGRLGAMLADRAPAGGLDLAPDGPLAGRLATAGPLVGRLSGLTPAGVLAVEVDLDPAALPFLDHHRIDGIPVLPGVMGVEGFAEVAGLLAPDLEVATVEDVEFLVPFKFYRDQPRTVRLEARLERNAGSGVLADCRLLGRREFAGGTEARETVHFTARVRLTAKASAMAGDPAALAVATVAPPVGDGVEVAAGDLYRIYFHGPAYQVVERAWVDGGAVFGRFAAGLPSDQPGGPGEGEGPDRLRMAPRLLELCLQTAGVGELGAHGRMALPRRLARAAVTRADLGPGPFVAVVRVGEGGAEAVVRDARGRAVATVAGYETIALPAELGEAELAPLRATLAPA